MSEPKLTVVLPTDTYPTIRPVIDRLRRQTARDQLEIILVAPSAEAVGGVMTHREEFAGIRILENPAPDLLVARAVGIRAATAPFVFVGETHSYPHPGFVETLIAGFSGPWSTVAPAFGNANPNGVLSWAAFLSDYGRWLEGMPAREISVFPIHNGGFKRSVLLALGDRLAPALAHGDELCIALRAAGHKAYFEPAAKLDHVNVASLRHWVRERFALGVLIANHRSSRWPLGRRALYILGSPLLPLVLSWRVSPGVWRTLRAKKAPLSLVFWIGFGLTVQSAGELAGYLGVSTRSSERLMYEYEAHKLRYAGPSP